jgi:hypothetical protein
MCMESHDMHIVANGLHGTTTIIDEERYATPQATFVMSGSRYAIIRMKAVMHEVDYVSVMR